MDTFATHPRETPSNDTTPHALESSMTVVNMCCDGSVKKTVVRQGQGPVPVRGDKVTVHYRGRIADEDDFDDTNGRYDSAGQGLSAGGATAAAAESGAWASDTLTTYFDDSFARGKPLTLTLGFDPVITGWTDVLSTMQAGERAEVTIAPDKGYGPMGRPPSIPPHSTLVFDMEVLAVDQIKKGADKACAEEGEELKPGGPIHTKASPKRSKVPQLKDVNGADGTVKRYLPAGALQGRAPPADDTPDDLSEVACEVLLYQHVPRALRQQGSTSTSTSPPSSAEVEAAVGEGSTNSSGSGGGSSSGGGSGAASKESREEKLKAVAAKVLAVRAVVTFVVDDGGGSDEGGGGALKSGAKGSVRNGMQGKHWEPLDWCVKELGKGETGDFVVSGPLAMNLYDSAGAAAAGSSSSEESSSPTASPPCAYASLFDVLEPMPSHLEDDRQATEAAIRALACFQSSEAEASSGLAQSVTTKKKGPAVFVRVKVVGLDKSCGRRLSKDLSVAEKLMRAGELRELGNAQFKASDFPRASRRYASALNLISLDQGYSVAERRAVRAEGLLCFLNRAQCSLKKGQWRNAKRDATCAVGIDPENGKALFRRGLALLGLEDWEAAKRDLEKVVQQDPTNAKALRSLRKAKVQCRQQDLEQRNLFSGRAFKDNNSHDDNSHGGEGKSGGGEGDGSKISASRGINIGGSGGDVVNKEPEKTAAAIHSDIDQAAIETSTTVSATTKSTTTAKAKAKATSAATVVKQKANKNKNMLLYDDKPDTPSCTTNGSGGGEGGDDAKFVSFDVRIPAGVQAGETFPFELPRIVAKPPLQPTNKGEEASPVSAFLSSLLGGTSEMRAEVEVTAPPGSKEGDTVDVRVLKDELSEEYGGTRKTAQADDDDDEPLSGPVGGGLVRPGVRTWYFVMLSGAALLGASGRGFLERRSHFEVGTNAEEEAGSGGGGSGGGGGGGGDGGSSGDLLVVAYLGFMLLACGLAGWADRQYSRSELCEVWSSMAFAMCLPSAATSWLAVLSSALRVGPALFQSAKSTESGLWYHLAPEFGPYGIAPNVVMGLVTIPLTYHLFPFLSTLQKVVGEKLAKAFGKEPANVALKSSYAKEKEGTGDLDDAGDFGDFEKAATLKGAAKKDQ